MPKIIQPNGKVETCFHIQSVVCHRLHLKKSFGLSTCKVVASNFSTEINSNGNNFNRPEKVYLKPTLECTYVNTAKRQHLYSCFQKKSNNNNYYNLTGRARTVSAIKYRGLVPVRLGKQETPSSKA